MREPLTVDSLRRFMQALGKAARERARVYLVGGATALLFGWRDTTIDVDLKIVPEHDALLQALQGLKEQLSVNIEMASPDLFIPTISGWENRSQFIAEEGLLTFLHYDLYSQALAKIERGHETDARDVSAMLRSGLIDPGRLRVMFEEIAPLMYRHPAIDAVSFRRELEKTLSVVHGQESDIELLRTAISKSGLSARRFAVEVLIRDERTVRRWLAGDSPLPAVVRDHLRALTS